MTAIKDAMTVERTGAYWNDAMDVQDFLADKVRDWVDDGRTLRELSRRTGLSHSSIKNMQDKIGIPTVATIIKFIEGLDLDTHEVAHIYFGLDLPSEKIELTAELRELCELVIALDKSERQTMIAFAEFLNRRDNDGA